MGNRKKVSWRVGGTWTFVVLLVAYPLCYPVAIALLTQVHYALIILSEHNSAIPCGVPVWCHNLVWSGFTPIDSCLAFAPDRLYSVFDTYFFWWMDQGLQITDLPSSEGIWCAHDTSGFSSP